MPPKKNSTAILRNELEARERFANLSVLVADRDYRTASLVQRLLFSFGFRHMDITTSGESALTLLRERSYDILITEWNMAPVDGLSLVKAIRNAKDDERLRRDVPIIMLTARTDIDSVSSARDAGISEYVAKPFSAKTISNRIIQIIDNPRAFVEAPPDYVGPDRRRKGAPPPGKSERRGKAKTGAIITPASATLRKQLGVDAADILNDIAIAKAQSDLLKAENDFIDWAKNDIERLERAYNQLAAKPSDLNALREIVDAAYAIKSQAGIFGYPLGTDVATLTVDYLVAHPTLEGDNLIVLRKQIDAIAVIFKQKIKESGQGIALDMITALKKLQAKLG